MFSLVIASFPDEESAASTARALVDRGLCACGSLFPCRSIYTWKGEIVDATETVLHMKTRSDLVSDVIDAIVASHPYEVPEVVAIRIDDGHLPYLEWIADATVGPG